MNIDLERVRRGDRLLSEAKQLHDDEGRPPRPVPTEEIANMSALTTEEIADILSMNVQTVRRWCREGKLPAVKFGKNYRVSRPELARWWRERGGGELFADNDDQAEGGADE